MTDPLDGTVLLQIGGKEFTGYWVKSGGIMTVRSIGPDGFPASRSAQVGVSPPLVVARVLLREIIAGT
jgi:hypothetical protein